MEYHGILFVVVVQLAEVIYLFCSFSSCCCSGAGAGAAASAGGGQHSVNIIQ